jgi:hypothetical protein
MCAALLLFFFSACGPSSSSLTPEDGEDAGREFVRAVLDGDYVKADMYVLPDDEDKQLFKRYTDYMRQQPGKELIELKQANITIHEIQHQGDSVVLINYSNSHSNKPANVKVIKRDGRWWVDFSYTFAGEKKTAP